MAYTLMVKIAVVIVAGCIATVKEKMSKSK